MEEHKNNIFLKNLEKIIPCRTKQIIQLYNLFSVPPYIDFLYLYGGPSVGKTFVITTILNELNIKYVIINLRECYTSKILFQLILMKLCNINNIKCDNLMEFIDIIKNEKEQLENTIIIIDNAEKLRSMESNLLPGFIKLRELTKIQISIIFITDIIIQKFHTKWSIVPSSMKIHFPQYNLNELLDILVLDYQTSINSIIDYYYNNNNDDDDDDDDNDDDDDDDDNDDDDDDNDNNKHFEFDYENYQKYLYMFLSVFYRVCRDLSELRHNALVHFIKYCKPVVDKEINSTESLLLWQRISPILKESLDMIYLRTTTTTTSITTLVPINSETRNISNLELPFYTKYLLIAAYLASYNPAKDDKKMFIKYGKKKKTLRNVKSKCVVSEKLNTQIGPKPFTLDRLLAIFYSILDDKIGFNNNILVEIKTLVNLQLLIAISDSTILDTPKYKCNVNLDFIKTIAKMVSFNITKYLSDFCHF